jgi:excisionase family DNA binding protein
MALTITKAAEMAGCNRSTIQRAIRAGRISATRDEASGAWMIEVAELCRVWPDAGAIAIGSINGTAAGNALPRTDDALAEMRELRARLADAHDQVADLRRRLDVEVEERRRLLSLHEQDQRLLADMREKPLPARRRWWQWGGHA